MQNYNMYSGIKYHKNSIFNTEKIIMDYLIDCQSLILKININIFSIRQIRAGFLI